MAKSVTGYRQGKITGRTQYPRSKSGKFTATSTNKPATAESKRIIEKSVERHKAALTRLADR